MALTVIEESIEYTPTIRILVAQIENTRNSVSDFLKSRLKPEYLDMTAPAHSNSIATLLRHMCALEEFYRLIIIENREFNEQEKQLWDGALPDANGICSEEGKNLNYYLQLWENVRSKTLEGLKHVDDDWLYLYPPGEFSEYGNNYYIIFHFMKDHLSHFGQMKSILSYFENKG